MGSDITASMIKYLFAVLAAGTLTYLLVPLLIPLAFRSGLVDDPGGRRTHKSATPLCGGIAIFVGFHLTMAILFAMGWGDYSGSLGRAEWLLLLGSSTALLLVGIADDRLSLSPWVKLGGQILVASVIYATGPRLDNLFAMQLHPVLSYIATVLWIVGAMNAFNLIDGMDGLATGLGLIGAVGLALLCMFSQRVTDALLMFALAGACIGFLRYNFHPARAFLGDAGSMLLGLILAWFSLQTSTKGPTLTTLLVPILAMGIPILDTTLAIWRRTTRRLHSQMIRSEGEPSHVFTADRDHLHHRLQAAGLSQQHAAIALYGIAAALVSVGLAVMLNASHRTGILMLAFAVFSYVVIRHLAYVELHDSTRLISEGLKRPPSKAIAVILYPPLDVLALSASFLLVLLLISPTADMGYVRARWLLLAPVGVGIPFLAMAVSRAYRRVWSRSRVSEYGLLALWLIGGICVAVAALDFLYGLRVQTMATMVATYVGAAVPSVLAIRVAPRLLQDCVGFIHRHERHDSQKRTLLYGAGYTATLFLREQIFGDVSEATRYDIRGFIDDDQNLHGRIVHSYSILGDLDALDSLIEKLRIELIIVTGRVSETNRAELIRMASQYGVEVSEWYSSIRLLYGGEAAEKNLKS